MVGSDDPAAERAVVLPGRAQPARLDHRQPGRPALHERGAPLRRGRARDVRRRGDRRRPRPVAGWSSTSATATATCSPGSRRASRSPAAGTSTAPSRRPPRSRRWPPRSTYRRTRWRRRSTGSTASRRAGVDEDFHRGESAYDKYYSDPTVKPNPSLQHDRPRAVLRREDRARRPRHQGRAGHRRAGPGAAAGRLGHRRACTPPATPRPRSWATPTPAPAPPSAPRWPSATSPLEDIAESVAEEGALRPSRNPESEKETA